MTTTKPVIFCVDDDANLLSWMELMLDDMLYTVVTETSAAKALERIQAAPPDVVLLDITMPEMDGYELCRRLQERIETAYVPVIFVTGRAGEQDRMRAFTVGGADFIAKPIKEDLFVQTVAAHVATRRKWSEVRKISSTKQEPPPVTLAHDPVTASLRWDAKLNPAGFSRFRDYLVARLKIPADRPNLISRISPAGLYSGAAELGLQSRGVAEALASFLALPFIPNVRPDQVRLGVLPTAFCVQNQVLALQDASGAPCFALSNPFNWEVLEALRRIIEPGKLPQLSIAEPAVFAAMIVPSKPGDSKIVDPKTIDAKKGDPKPVETKSASMAQIEAAIQKELEEPIGAGDGDERKQVEDGPLVELVNRLIESAFEAGASDIHIEPSETDIVVRYRIDGDLHIVNRLSPPAMGRRIIARLKVMSALDLAERRLPQDGRIAFKKYSRNSHDFDLRVAVLPVQYGEKACMRIIDKQKSVMPLEKLGFSEGNLKLYREKIQAPYGLILHVGPTGSGKSMSLYAALNEIMSPAINIHTAEDPIEYTLPGISQVQVNADIGFTFARALRSFLRMDPDVILVGEIRDLETAKIAIEASLTGHVVFSTLHTNDAASTVTRFIEMGIDPYLVSSSLVLVCAQRLLKRLCPDCRECYDASPEERRLLGAKSAVVRLYRAKGCERCNKIGYKGRIAIHEILAPNDEIRRAINRPGITAEEIKKLAMSGVGMSTLWGDSGRKVLAGLCSLEDALANVSPDETSAPAAEERRPARAAVMAEGEAA